MDIDEILNALTVESIRATGPGYESKMTIPKAKEAIERLVLEARYEELTGLGKLYSGNKIKFLDHYEERYKFLRKELGIW